MTEITFIIETYAIECTFE